MKDATLADRPAAMGALIVPGDQLAADVENADFGAVAGHHPALPLGDLTDSRDHEGLHVILSQSAFRIRSSIVSNAH
jgi:hypothetical protein